MDLFGEETPPPEASEKAEEASGNGVDSPQQARLPCLGHDAQMQDLCDRLSKNRLPHALILSGQEGIGKATFADQFIKTLLGEKHVALIESGGHPDILRVKRQTDSAGRVKGSVEVSEIRKVPSFLHMTASMGGWRVVLIDDADTMNRNAQNALLKNLEEPPKDTLIMLITHRLGALIPTIRSRAHTVSFLPLSLGDFTTVLQANAPEVSESQVEALYNLSSHSIGYALRLIENNGIEILDRILGVLNDYPSYNWANIHGLADEIGRKGHEPQYDTFQNITLTLARELIVIKARAGTTTEHAFESAFFTSILQNSSLEKLSKICENLQEHFAQVQHANLDKRQGVMDAFSIMQAA